MFKQSEIEESPEQLKLKVKMLEEQVQQLIEEKERLINDTKYVKKEYKYVNEEKLNPPAYIPSKEEINLAMARYAIENNIWEIIHNLEIYIDSLEGKTLSFPYTKEKVEKYGKKALEQWNDAMEKWEGSENLWDAFVDPKWFNDAYVAGLSDMHAGDCTAIACSCMRCHAEGMFKIPHTANWGKHEGSKLYSQYCKDFDEKNPKLEVKAEEKKDEISTNSNNNVSKNKM